MELSFVQFVEVDDAEQGQQGMRVLQLLVEQFPLGLVLLGRVASGEVEVELRSVGLGQEVLAVEEGPDLVELTLHEGLNGLRVRLEAVLPRRDGTVDLAADLLDRLREGRVVFGLPAPDELRSIVRLPGAAVERDAAQLKVMGLRSSQLETQPVRPLCQFEISSFDTSSSFLPEIPLLTAIRRRGIRCVWHFSVVRRPEVDAIGCE